MHKSHEGKAVTGLGRPWSKTGQSGWDVEHRGPQWGQLGWGRVEGVGIY